MFVGVGRLLCDVFVCVVIGVCSSCRVVVCCSVLVLFMFWCYSSCSCRCFFF